MKYKIIASITHKPLKVVDDHLMFIEEGFMKLGSSWMISKESECHRSIYGIKEGLDILKRGLELEGQNIPTITTPDDLKNHLLDEANTKNLPNYFLVLRTTLSHTYFLEVCNSSKGYQARILSLFSTKYGFKEYMDQNPLGKFQSLDSFLSVYSPHSKTILTHTNLDERQISYNLLFGINDIKENIINIKSDDISKEPHLHYRPHTFYTIECEKR